MTAVSIATMPVSLILLATIIWIIRDDNKRKGPKTEGIVVLFFGSLFAFVWSISKMFGF